MDDIASRIEANRGAALSYVTSTETPAYLGMGATCDATPATIQEQDAAEWCDALQGVSEVIKRAALLRGRSEDEVGLVEQPAPGQRGAT